MTCSTLIKCILITLHRIWTSWIGYSSIERVVATPFPLPLKNSSICLIRFLWIYHDRPPYLLYLLEKLVDGFSDDRLRPQRSTTATTSL